MFKAIKEFFLGKPAQAPEVAVPYKVEPAPAPVEFTPPPKAADVVVEAPVPAVTNGVGNVPLGNGSSAVTDSLLSVKPEPATAPAKKPAARRRPANAKKAPVKKPVAK
jgi:hypothetical protein